MAEQSFDTIASNITAKAQEITHRFTNQEFTQYDMFVADLRSILDGARPWRRQSVMAKITDIESEDRLTSAKRHQAWTVLSAINDDLLYLHEKLLLVADNTEFDTVDRNSSREVARTILDWCSSIREAQERIKEVVDPMVDMLDNESSYDFVELARQEKINPVVGKGKGKQRPAIAKNAQVKMPAVGLPKNLEVDEKDITPGEAVFQPRPARTGYWRTAEVTAPFVKGKRINKRDLPNHPPSSVSWNVVADAVYYSIPETSIEIAAAAVESGYLPTHAYKDQLSRGRFADDDAPLAKGLTAANAVGVLSQQEINVADSLYWEAQIELLLKNTRFSNKLTFVEKWVRRLQDVPDTLQNGVPDVIKKLYTFLRFAIKENTSMNKPLYAFLLGNLASWRVGESRDDFLKRARPSVKAFWGVLADTYESEFLSIPWVSETNVRAKPNAFTKRLRNLAETKTRDLFQAANDLAASGSKLAGEVKENLERKVDEINRLNESVSWADRARHAFGKVRAQAYGLITFHRNPDATVVVDGQEIKLTSELTWRNKAWRVLKLTVGRPFYTDVKKVGRTASGEVLEFVACAPRPWWDTTITYLRDHKGTNHASPLDGWRAWVPLPVLSLGATIFESGRATVAGAERLVQWVGKKINHFSDNDLTAPTSTFDPVRLLAGTAITTVYGGLVAGAIWLGTPVIAAFGATIGTEYAAKAIAKIWKRFSSKGGPIIPEDGTVTSTPETEAADIDLGPAPSATPVAPE